MRYALMTLTAALLLAIPGDAFAHCEVPCGIFTDQQRFEAMLEDTKTIAKAQVQIAALAGKTDAQSINQRVRWVVTKEEHAKRIQYIIAQYFMAQRIKTSDKEGYVKKLTAAHAVMVAAMKSKQSVDAATATTLRKAILDFYRAYEGKEPQTHDKK